MKRCVIDIDLLKLDIQFPINLEEIYLYGVGEYNAELLKKLPSVKTLKIAYGTHSDPYVTKYLDVNKLKDLEVLVLEGCSVGTAVLDELPKLKTLKLLYVRGEDIHMRLSPKNTELRRLELDVKCMNLETIEYYQKLEYLNLDEISLSEFYGDFFLLKKLPNLKAYQKSIGYDPLNMVRSSNYMGLSSLKRVFLAPYSQNLILNVYGKREVSGLELLEQAQNLDTIHIHTDKKFIYYESFSKKIAELNIPVSVEIAKSEKEYFNYQYLEVLDKLYMLGIELNDPVFIPFNIKIEMNKWEGLENLKSIKQLKIRSKSCNPQVLSNLVNKLKQLPQLEEIKIWAFPNSCTPNQVALQALLDAHNIKAKLIYINKKVRVYRW